VLSPQTKWTTQADAAGRWQVDVSTVIGIRRTVKEAAPTALAVRPGRPAKERDWELERARAEIAQLTDAIKSQAIELAIVRGKAIHGPWRPPGPDEILVGRL